MTRMSRMSQTLLSCLQVYSHLWLKYDVHVEKKTTCRNLKWCTKAAKHNVRTSNIGKGQYGQSQSLSDSEASELRLRETHPAVPATMPPCHPQKNKENNQPLFAAPAFLQWMQIMSGVKGVNSLQF